MANPGTVTQRHSASMASPDESKIARFRRAAHKMMVVIPARDEAADVGDIVRQVTATGLPVVVVDDHSADCTAEAARRAGASVLQLPFHAGAWAAIQAGMRFARQHGYEFVATLDADGQHDPADLESLLERIDAADHPNVVIGACVDRANRRRRLAWRVLRWLSGLDIQDLTSGFRIYDRKALALLAQPHQTLLEYQDVGVLLCLHAHGMRVCEVEVPMCARAHGISRIFRSWPMVVYYLIYSALIGTSRRGRRTEPTE